MGKEGAAHLANRDGIIWAYWGHEPVHHYRRLGGDRLSIFKNGDWVDEWYERLHDESAVRRAAELNINVVYTHFFKGFGLNAEREEMERTRDFVRLAHRYGIQVLGYCQLNSLYYETMRDEADDLEQWAGRREDGGISCWSGAYYRWATCYNSDAFKQYIKKVVAHGLRHVGLDGFHFDNSYNRPCYCERCQDAFRRFAAARLPDPERVLGLRHLRHIRIPPFREWAETVQDPLYAVWLHYRRQLVASVHGELFGYVKQLSDNRAIVAHNPAFPKRCGNVNRLGYEPAYSPGAVDVVFAENDSFIEWTGRGLKSQIEAYKYGQLFGYRVFNSSWLKDGQGNIRLPETSEEISLYEAEALAFGGICGSPWLMRPLKDGSRCVLDRTEQTDTLSRVYAYFVKHADLYVRTSSTNAVKVLYHPDNLMLSIKQGYLSLLAVVQSLVRHGTPFSFWMLNDSRPLGDGDLLVLPGLDYVSDADVAAVRSLAEKGHPIVIVGSFATYTEYGVERGSGTPRLDDNGSTVVLPCRIDAAGYEPHKHFSAMNADIAEFDTVFVEAVKTRTAEKRIDCSHPGLLFETALDADGHKLVHVINPNNGETVERLTLSLWGVTRPYGHCELYSFEQSRLAGFANEKGRIDIVVEQVKTFFTLKLY